MTYDDEGQNFDVEAMFLGLAALVVVIGIVFVAFTTNLGGIGPIGGTGNANTNIANPNITNSNTNVTITDVYPGSKGTVGTIQSVNSAPSATRVRGDVICACYNEGFELAGKTDNVQSAAYRTGFSQCRALGSVEGGNAWTAGWEARRTGRPFEVTCKAYKRRAGR